MTEGTRKELETMPLLSRLLLWTDGRYAIIGIIVVIGLICAALAGFDVLHHRHVKFDVEETPFIYGLFGFAVYAAIVFFAKGLRRLISRPEDFYGANATDCEMELSAGTEQPQETDHA